MAAKKLKETLPARKRKDSSNKNSSAAFKSSEIVSDSDVSEPEPAPKLSSQAESSQRKLKPSSYSLIATKASSGSKQDSSNQPKTSPVSSEAEGSEEESTEEETSDRSNSEEDVSSSSTSPSLPQEKPSVPTPGATATVSAGKSPYIVASVNGVKRKAKTELESEKRDGQEEEEGLEDEDEEEEDVDDDDSSGSDEDDNESGSTSAKENALSQAVQTQRPLKAYEPPAGFKTTKISFAHSSEMAGLLQPSSLEGKQIWHITAPGEFPLDSLKSISEKNLRDGSSILSHENTEYGLVQDQRQLGGVLLLPSDLRNQYCRSQAPVSATYHISQIIRLPIFEAAPITSAAEVASEPHQQPKGLKMRFHPFGASSDSDSDSDKFVQNKRSAPAPAPAFRHPPTADKSANSKKTKHKDSANSRPAEQPLPVKPKKSESATHVNGSDQMDGTPSESRKAVPEKEKVIKRKQENPSTISKSTSKTAAKPRIAESDAMDVDSPPPPPQSQPKLSPPSKDNLNPSPKKRKLSEKPNNENREKSTTASKPTAKAASKTLNTNHTTMDIGAHPPSPPAQPQQKFSEHSPKSHDSTLIKPTIKETPEQRAKRKEEKRRQRALQKQQLSQHSQQPVFSSPERNGISTPFPSKTLKSDPPTLPLSEYSARLSSAEKAKPANSSQTAPGSSQTNMASQSSPSGKKSKKVRWKEGVGDG